jgi:phage gpG-like protein
MLTVEVKAGEAQRKLKRLADTLSDRRQVNKALSVSLWNMVQRNFQTESHDGKPWEKLAPSTIRARERKQKKAISRFKILQDTGALRQSFDFFSDNDLAGVGSVASKGHADLSIIHELGLRVPARPMLPARAKALAEALNIYGHFVERAVRS